MKTCPQCNTAYEDDTLNFCLEDGTMLTTATVVEQEPPATVMMQPPAQTEYKQPAATFETPTAPSVRAKGGGSRTVLWVALILGGIALLCGGGFVGLVAVGVITDEGEDTEPIVKEKKQEEPVNRGSSNGDPDRTLVSSINPADWESGIKEGPSIQAESTSNGLELRTKKGYFYVILTKDGRTYDRSTLLTVKNVRGKRATSGFGLVIHSYAKPVLERDYAFVIRSDNGTFRIIRHENKKERNLVGWTKSSAIKRGTASNDLEIRAKGDQMRFYINGELVKTLRDYTNYKKGVAGVYTSDADPIAFQNLEIRE